MAQTDILKLIQMERVFQDTKWGEQNHSDLKWLVILIEEVGEIGKAILEGKDAEIDKEIIQSAAVCVAWLECQERIKDMIDKEGKDGTE